MTSSGTPIAIRRTGRIERPPILTKGPGTNSTQSLISAWIVFRCLPNSVFNEEEKIHVFNERKHQRYHRQRCGQGEGRDRESRRQNEAGYSRRRPKDQECRAETEGFYQISGRPRVRQDCILASVPSGRRRFCSKPAPRISPHGGPL